MTKRMQRRVHQDMHSGLTIHPPREAFEAIGSPEWVEIEINNDKTLTIKPMKMVAL